MTNKLILATLFTLAVAPMASADVELRITGATAFRAAVHAGLQTGFFANNTYQYAHGNAAGAVSGASRSLWKGTVTGQGTVTVRCAWSGSVTGIQALATTGTGSPLQVAFLTDANLTTAAAAGGGEASGKSATATQTAHMAFSDCYQNSTIYTTPSLTEETAGIIPFIWCVNDSSATGSTLARYGFDNITSQFARALMVSGTQPKSLLTGNPADTTNIYGIGRDPGSGTRLTVLAETKHGVFTPVTQYKITSASDAVTNLQVWPTTGAPVGTYDPATGNDYTAGNGGYTSGGTLAGQLIAKSSASFTKTSATGSSLGSDSNALLVAFLGTSDALTVFNGGGAYLKYEGVSYTGQVDDDKIRTGQYTAWANEHIYYSSLTSTTGSSQTAIKDLLKTQIDANIGTAGITFGSMQVFRSEDGGTVAP